MFCFSLCLSSCVLSSCVFVLLCLAACKLNAVSLFGRVMHCLASLRRAPFWRYLLSLHYCRSYFLHWLQGSSTILDMHSLCFHFWTHYAASLMYALVRPRSALRHAHHLCLLILICICYLMYAVSLVYVVCSISKSSYSVPVNLTALPAHTWYGQRLIRALSWIKLEFRV